MSLYVFSNEAENDLLEIYRYGFINYGENKADLYIDALRQRAINNLPILFVFLSVFYVIEIVT